MEGAVIYGLICLGVGLFLFWIGFQHWRYRHEETIGALEAAFLKATDDEPKPLTRLDWFLKYFQAIMGFILGPFFALIGIIVILNELEIL
ncbi:MAG: hypothetical protein AAF494_07820 [Pseudomonadota bacterium]